MIKVKDLLKQLLDYNPDADVSVIVNNKKYNFSITIGGSEGVTEKNTDEVHFYVDELCSNENTTEKTEESEIGIKPSDKLTFDVYGNKIEGEFISYHVPIYKIKVTLDSSGVSKNGEVCTIHKSFLV